MAGVEPGTLWVLPDNLANIIEALESRGITRIESGTHAEMGSLTRHTTFLDGHHNHHRVDEGREIGPSTQLDHDTSIVEDIDNNPTADNADREH